MGISDDRKVTMGRYNKLNKARILHQSALYRDSLRLEMIQAYGGKCQKCPESDPIVLVLDHINDDPEPEYATCGSSSRGGYSLYRKLREQNWPTDRFQLLCCNCNMRKEHLRRRAAMVETLGPAPSDIGDVISRTEARAKAGPNSNNSSGFKGVLRDKQRGKWTARTTVNSRIISFGRFSDIRDAAKAYRAGMRKLYGETIVHLSDDEIELVAAEYGKTIEVDQTISELGL